MDDVAIRFERLKKQAAREWRRRWRPKAFARTTPAEWRGLAADAGIGVAKIALIIALPFAVLVRGAVFIHEHGRTSVWLALLVAGLLTGAVVTMYAVWIASKLTTRGGLGARETRGGRGARGRRALVLPLAKWVALPLVVFYCSYSLIYLASVNAKSAPVRAYYTSLHPLLRLALSTIILVDRDILITDAGRQREDYARMGLPANNRTRHYKQKDGWVHAVDLRTSGRGAVKNRGVQFYFWLMGFDTRRHVGTADHLHVELN